MSHGRFSDASRWVYVEFPFEYSDGRPGLLVVNRISLDEEGEIVLPTSSNTGPFWDCTPDGNITLDGHPANERYDLQMVVARQIEDVHLPNGGVVYGQAGLGLEEELKAAVRAALDKHGDLRTRLRQKQAALIATAKHRKR